MKIVRALLAAAAILFAAAAPSHAAQYTSTPVSLTSSGWTDLGAGPLEVSLISNSAIYVIASDTTPAADARGELLGGSLVHQTHEFFNTAGHIWARAISDSGATVVATPLVTQPLILGAGSSAIGSISNTAFGISGSLPAGSAIIGKVGFDPAANSVAISGALPAGTNIIGSIGNSAFGISGSLPAGSNTIGKVGIDGIPAASIDQTTPDTTNAVSAGTINSVCVTPTITANTYSAGQQVGGLLTFSGIFNARGRGVIQSIVINSKTKQATGGLRFFPIVGNPTATTWTDRSTPAINAADAFRVRTPYDLATPYSDLGTHTVWGALAIGQAINAGSTTMYGVLVATTALAAFGSTSDIQICLKALADL